MDNAARIEFLRTKMQEQGVAGVFLPLDASLEYFTGAPRAKTDNTRQRQNSAEYAGLLITEKEVVYFNSRLSALGLLATIERYPLISQVVTFPDGDLCGETFVGVCGKLGLTGQKLAYLQDITSSLVLRLQKDLAVSWVDFDSTVQRMRAKKDPKEQLLMGKAASVCDKIYNAVFPKLQPGAAVEEIAAEIDRLALVFGAEATSFTTSVMNFGPLEGAAYGDHYPVLRRGYVLAFDYGVLYQGYCSDFGRTVFIGEPKPDIIKAYELIVRAQKEAITAMKAGQVRGAELNRLARRIIAEGGYDREFGHRLGHGIGKDVHERPFLAEGEERILESGMCFTVEPSLCFPRRALIRVEDVVMAGPEGGENLNTTNRDLVVIE
ncbi:MAG: Xaa-Pro peptidase family protein [Clostridiales bacterium]|nr:Xaa-Pro peptidase family protein [Clostridiales bacterium]